jgi:hypothetical protein
VKEYARQELQLGARHLERIASEVFEAAEGSWTPKLEMLMREIKAGSVWVLLFSFDIE